ncbi:hypothetical protein ACFVTC_26410 [Streptomyces sp. NPDC057950]|uniref:hypothetical protein n=1 Tax=Streptomyces sp. NPDC057950 TaxID=3346288 RepID=UPI0036EB6C2E
MGILPDQADRGAQVLRAEARPGRGPRRTPPGLVGREAVTVVRVRARRRAVDRADAMNGSWRVERGEILAGGPRGDVVRAVARPGRGRPDAEAVTFPDGC